MVPVDARRFTADVALLTHLEGTVGNANERVIVLANRAPVRHERCGGRVVSTRSASGLVTALEPLLEKYSGTWVAHAAGSADTDVVDTLGGIGVPPANPRYRVRYVPLRTGEFQGYYYGFANEGLWPLCHTAGVAPTFRRGDFEKYREVNAKFA
jgi:trehalose 6-phosphate synthase/phosphatase